MPVVKQNVERGDVMSNAQLQDALEAYRQFIEVRRFSGTGARNVGRGELDETITTFVTVLADDAVNHFSQRCPEFTPFRQDLLGVEEAFQFVGNWKHPKYWYV